MSPSGTAAPGADPEPPSRRSVTALALLSLAALIVFSVLLALGTWQVHRLAWKRALIARVAARIAAPSVAAPAPAQWSTVSAVDDEYQRIEATGRFVPGIDIPVQAVTEYGGGFWVMSPLRTDKGFIVFVNRGFVTPDRRDRATAPGGIVTVSGLLRMSEPGGAFLRANDPKNGRWYSRDVAAMASSRGLDRVAPYFIDAEASQERGDQPIGGLTVIAFPNNHLVYALTWYGLAGLLAVGAAWVARDEMRSRGRGRAV